MEMQAKRRFGREITICQKLAPQVKPTTIRRGETFWERGFFPKSFRGDSNGTTEKLITGRAITDC